MAFSAIVRAGILSSLRKPGFCLTVAIFGALIFLSHFFALFTLGEETSMVSEVGVSSIFLCGVLMSVFLCTGSFSSKTEAGTLAILLTKPISRTRVLLAGVVANLLTSWIALGILTFLFFVTLALDANSLSMLVVQALVLAFLASAVAAGITTLFATFLPFSAALLASLCLFALGSVSGHLFSLAGTSSRVLLGILYSVAPDYDILNLVNRLSSGEMLLASSLVFAITYGIAYFAATLTIASIVFARREIS
jgi:ABC-type transport system involved in multi-copper enzyme maturation permease subunit